MFSKKINEYLGYAASAVKMAVSFLPEFALDFTITTAEMLKIDTPRLKNVHLKILDWQGNPLKDAILCENQMKEVRGILKDLPYKLNNLSLSQSNVLMLGGSLLADRLNILKSFTDNSESHKQMTREQDQYYAWVKEGYTSAQKVLNDGNFNKKYTLYNIHKNILSKEFAHHMKSDPLKDLEDKSVCTNLAMDVYSNVLHTDAQGDKKDNGLQQEETKHLANAAFIRANVKSFFNN